LFSHQRQQWVWVPIPLDLWSANATLTNVSERIQVNEEDQLPIAPLFLLDNSGEWIQFESTVATDHTLFRLRSAKRYEFIAYDANQTKWKKQYENPHFSIWNRFQQYIRSAKVVVPVRWDQIGRYDIEELRDLFLKAVQHDDDVLTQFVEREDLISLLNAATTFDDLVRIWDWLLTEELT
jgi:hypothetical protein